MGHIALFSETVITGSELQFANTSFEFVCRAVSVVGASTVLLLTPLMDLIPFN